MSSSSSSPSVASKLHVLHCFDAILHQLQGQPCHPKVKHTWKGEKFPLFVTWKKRHSHGSDWKLRGCIGTFSPKELASGLREYACIAAFQDSRFTPISLSELPSLRCDISLLTNFELMTGSGGNASSAQGVWAWEVGVHGISIEFQCPATGRRHNATFLPEVAREQGWSQKQTMQELIYKSGYRGKVDASLYARIQLTRYQSEKESLTYQQYVELRATLTGQVMQQALALATASAAAAALSAAQPMLKQMMSDEEEEEEEEEEFDEEELESDEEKEEEEEDATMAAHSSASVKKAKLPTSCAALAQETNATNKQMTVRE